MNFSIILIFNMEQNLNIPTLLTLIIKVMSNLLFIIQLMFIKTIKNRKIKKQVSVYINKYLQCTKINCYNNTCKALNLYKEIKNYINTNLYVVIVNKLNKPIKKIDLTLGEVYKNIIN